MSTSKSTLKKSFPKPSKIAASKVYDYIKKIEVDGYPRVRAYAEAIDPRIYDLTPSQITDKLDYLRSNYKGYNDIRESVLAEQQDWILRKSARIQDKSVTLLANLLDKANEMVTNPDADVKEINASIQMLKTIMPAFNNNTNEGNTKASRKKRASKFIN